MNQKEYLQLRRKAADRGYFTDQERLLLEEYETNYIRDFGSNWVTTINGAMLSISNPQPESILLEDIAHGLSMVCRYNGHVRKFYSVAQHSVYVSRLVPKKYAMHGLMHDASEALIGDVISPVKRAVGTVYHDIEYKVMNAVGKKFGFRMTEKAKAVVKIADLLMLRTEMRDLTNYCYKSGPTLPEIIIPQSPEEAKKSFLERYEEIVNARKGKR